MIFYDCVGWIPQILAKNHLPLWMIVWLWLCLFPSATEDMNIFRTWCLTGCSLLYSGGFNHLLCSTWFHLWYSCAHIYIYICINYARNVQTWTHKQKFTHVHTIPHAHSNLLAPAAIWGTQKEGHVPWCGDSRTGTQGVVSSHNGWLLGIIDDD